MDDPSALSIRRSELRDVREIRLIDVQVYPNPWSEKLTIHEITENGRVHFVAEQEHRVVGHAGLAILEGVAHITTIAVAPTHQRRGIGGRLLSELFTAASINGCHVITLEVRASNSPAIALYKRDGMIEAGVRPKYYGDNGEDAIIMSVEFSNG